MPRVMFKNRENLLIIFLYTASIPPLLSILRSLGRNGKRKSKFISHFSTFSKHPPPPNDPPVTVDHPPDNPLPSISLMVMNKGTTPWTLGNGIERRRWKC
ncbi:hypothetical protein CDAR_621301 [Caerostris darwini]|uniref:Uncharacterized protein n=1 Tax=Caerostris darwini TaxID=1538125 RepID=A0AAV4RQX3_9ARAC|nr:hypothetical protein CDAR_621301 [Caerostris darwini]